MGMIEIPEHTIELLNVPHPFHDHARQLYEDRNFAEAGAAFAEAATISRTRTIRLNEIVPGADSREVELNRDVAYGRVLLHWAISTEAQYRGEPNDELRHQQFSLALARASRGLVLLTQDQHGLVKPEELDTAKETVNFLKERVATSSEPQGTLASVPEQTVNTSDTEITRLTEEAEQLAA